MLGPQRSREHEPSLDCIQLPETGPQGRIYRQLGDVDAKGSLVCEWNMRISSAVDLTAWRGTGSVVGATGV